jgi:uncharacterized membrane protein YphA (DoxX/SURF4 family)
MICTQTQSNSVEPTAKGTAADLTGLAARWILGGVFVYMGLLKALEPDAFLKLVREYHLVTNPLLLNSIAAGLPWFEVFCGLLLLTGVAVRGSALVIIGMLVPFTFIILKRALSMSITQHVEFCAIKFDCGCGGGEVLSCHKLVENACLLLLSCWILSGRGRFLAARYTILGVGNSSSAGQSACTAPSSEFQR